MFFVLPSEVILDSLNQSFVFNTCVVDCSRLCKMELPLFDGLLKFSDLCPLHDTNEISFLAKITELARYIEAKNIYAFYSSSDFGFSEYLPIFFSLAFSLELILAFLSVSATCILNTLIAIIPILVVCVFIFLEIFVATLQSYVFAILTVIYLRDTITLH